MATLYVARHGQTDWNAERRWQGHADPPLNDKGRAEALALGQTLRGRGIERIYSSDLGRASETGKIVAAVLGVSVELDERLREVDVGEWSGLTTDEVVERFPEGYLRRREGQTGWTDGEPFEAMARRVVEVATEIAERNPDAGVLLVTHGGPLRALSTEAADADTWVSAGNCDYDTYVVEAGRMRRLDSSRGGLHQQIQG
jgi:broad specificity phosphatase PhoE